MACLNNGVVPSDNATTSGTAYCDYDSAAKTYQHTDIFTRWNCMFVDDDSTATVKEAEDREFVQ